MTTSTTAPAAPAARPATSRGTALVLAASFAFSSSGPLAKPAMDAGLGPQQVASVRIGVAALALLAVVGLWRPRLLRVRRSDWRVLAAYGLVGVAGVQVLYFAAVARVPIGVAMLLEFTSPIFIALWVRFVRHTVLSARSWVGTALAMVGLVLVAQVWQGPRLDAVGLAAGIAAALCGTAYFLVGEHAAAAPSPLGLVTWGMVVGAAVIFVVAPPWSVPLGPLGAEAVFAGLHVPVWTLLVTCAVLATAAAYLLSTSSLRYLPANVASVLALCEPVLATAIAWLALGQELTPAQLAGAAVLLTGAAIVQLASRRGTPPVALQ